MKNLYKLTIILIALAMSTSLMAADQIVDNNADAGVGTTLREAIAAVHDGGSITFNISGSDIVTIASELSISSIGMTINGYNTATGNNISVQVTAPGTSVWRVFNINASGKTINISNMIVKGGDVSLLGDNKGGGILLDVGTLNLETVTISGSKAWRGGGIYSVGSSNTLTIINSTVSDNESTSAGGGICCADGALIVENSTFSGNSAPNFNGGGIFNYSATVTIANSTFSSNSALNYGGGIGTQSTGNIYLLNSIVINNTAATSGLDIYNNGGTIRAYYCWYASTYGTIGGSDNNNSAYAASDLAAIAYNGGFTNTSAVSLAANNSSDAGGGTFAYYNSTDGYYFYNGSNYTKISTGGTFSPSDPASDKILTDQRGYYRMSGTVWDGNTPSEVTSDITRGAYQYYGVVAREGGTWSSGGDYYTKIKGAAERETSGTIVLAGTAILEPGIALDDSETITIQGAGSSSTIVQADDTPNTASDRVFNITAGSITLEDITIRNGYTFNPTADVNDGAGILINGASSVVINHCNLKQ